MPEIIIDGYNRTGSPLGINNDGSINIGTIINTVPISGQSNNFNLDIARSNYSNISYINKFGRNPDIDTSSNFEAIWNGGGDYTGFDATTAQKIEIFSSDAADTSGTGVGAHTLTLPRALTGDFVLCPNEIIELNGTNSVYTSGLYIRSSRGIITTAGASGVNIGEITARQSGTTANIFMVMPIGYNQTMIACDTIPSGTTAYLNSWFASLSAKKTGISNIRLLIRPFEQVFNVKEEFAIATIGTSYVNRIYTIPKNAILEKSDIKIMADTNIDNQGISAGFDLILINN